MKTFERLSPTTLTFPDLTDTEAQHLRSVLSYKDPDIDFQLKKLLPKYAKARYIERHGWEAYTEKVDDLKAKLHISMLKEGAQSTMLSGLAQRLYQMGYTGPGLAAADDNSPRPYALNYKPKTMRYYQDECVDALRQARHAGASMPTGSGKSAIIEKLVKKNGGRAVVMAPSISIAEQLFDQFTEAFGKSCVGYFADGKRESKKDLVVGTGQSFAKTSGDHARNLKRAKIFIGDESHLMPTIPFGTVGLELLPHVEERYFLSATQFRNDGTDLLLEGITGPIVYEKSLSELVDQGFLARPKYMFMETESPSTIVTHDWTKMVDAHYYDNARLAQEAAALANRCRQVFGHPVLILIDKVKQFQYLLPHLRHEVGFAHGTLSEDSEEYVDDRFKVSDNKQLVRRFNDGELPILVGTSCITTGTDLRPTGTIIFLMAGSSEIKFMQAVGRGTRRVEGKDSFNFIFFRHRIPGLEGEYHVFERHFQDLCQYTKPFGYKELKFRG